MGMARDTDASGGSASPATCPDTGSVAYPGTKLASQRRHGADASMATAGMNAEETALILASLSKGQFGAVAFASEDSDLDDSSKHHSDDMDEDLSGDEHDDDADEHATNRVHRVQQINFDGPVGSKLDFLDDAGFSHRFRNESNRVKSLVTKHISIDELRAHFDRPIIDVAKDFGICITLMKKICRRNGIKRWPHRQIRSLSKSIASMEAAMLSTHGSEREKYRDQISNLKMKRESVIADPNKENSTRPKASTAATAPATGLRDATNAMARPSSKVSSLESQQPLHAASTGPAVIKTEAPSTASSTSAAASAAPSTHSKGGRWTSEEHAAFLEGIRLYGKDWRRVAQVVVTRSAVQTRTHAQKYLLKFAGRFPFETPANGDARPDAASEDTEMTSPRSSSMSHTMLAAASDADRSTWSTDDAPASRIAVEAMAMILNSPDSVSPQTTASSSSSPSREIDRSARDALMYSPMSATSSFGRALPSLAIPPVKKTTEALSKVRESPVSDDDVTAP